MKKVTLTRIVIILLVMVLSTPAFCQKKKKHSLTSMEIDFVVAPGFSCINGEIPPYYDSLFLMENGENQNKYTLTGGIFVQGYKWNKSYSTGLFYKPMGIRGKAQLTNTKDSIMGYYNHSQSQNYLSIPFAIRIHHKTSYIGASISADYLISGTCKIDNVLSKKSVFETYSDLRRINYSLEMKIGSYIYINSNPIIIELSINSQILNYYKNISSHFFYFGINIGTPIWNVNYLPTKRS